MKRIAGARGGSAVRAAVRRALRALRRFPRDRSGATALEYGLICLLIFLTAVSAIRVYTNATSGMYDAITSAVTNATGGK